MTQQAEPDAIPDDATTAKGAPEESRGTPPEKESLKESSKEPSKESSPERETPSEQEAPSERAMRGDAFGAAFCASMAALSAEVVVAATVGLLVLLSREHQGLPHGPMLIVAVALGVLLLTVLISGFITAAAVMPALALGRLAARRAGHSGRRPWTLGAVAAVSAGAVIAFGAVAALGSRSLAGPLSYLTWWASLTVGLLPAAFVARAAARRVRDGRSGSVARRVTRDGAIAWLAVGLVGAVVYGSGLVNVYKPPRLHKSDLAGVWDDGHGGQVKLTKEGEALAKGLDSHQWDGAGKDRMKDCDGTGTWTALKDGGRVQGLSLVIKSCEGMNPRNWSLGGTTKQPRIYYEIGKPGSGKRYELRKVVKGKK